VQIVGKRISLLWVLPLLGIAGIVFFFATRAVDSSPQASIAKVRMDLAGYHGLIEKYHAQFNRYPTDAEGLQGLVNSELKSGVKPYNDPWGMPYIYRTQRDAFPQIYSSGPNRVDEFMRGDDIY
jgi:Type II secretion system (T2SS), protein G